MSKRTESRKNKKSTRKTDTKKGVPNKNTKTDGAGPENQKRDIRNRTFKETVTSYVAVMEAMYSSFPPLMIFLQGVRDKTTKDFETLRDTYGRVEQVDDQTQKIHFPIHCATESDKLLRHIGNLRNTLRIVPRTFLMSLVSQYDVFVGQLLATIFYTRPEILNTLERNLSFADLVQFNSLEGARAFLIEKEIESVMRDSHAKQFDWLEKKLNMPLRQDLASWPTFIEITERRNLFAHTDGTVSRQYLNVCAQNGVPHSLDAALGRQLYVSRDYFRKANETLFEIGVKLAHVIWRKLAAAEREEADGNLSLICYDLIKARRYQLAQVLLDFACGLKTFSSDRNRRVLIVNRAQAYKFGGNESTCREILSREDWSSCGRDFGLCVAVLEDKFSDAAKIMRAIGKDNEMKRFFYIDWPVFRDFRKSPEFLGAYKEIYGEDFAVQSPTVAEKSKDISANVDGR